VLAEAKRSPHNDKKVHWQETLTWWWENKSNEKTQKCKLEGFYTELWLKHDEKASVLWRRQMGIKRN